MIKIKKKLSLKNFYEMQLIEKYYYSDEYITPAKESYLWYKNHPNSIRVAVENGEVVGFINLFPIPKDIYEQIQSGEYNDSEMTYRDIQKVEKTDMEIYLFLSCLAIKQSHRKSDALKILLESYIAYYEKLIQSGTQIKGIITDNITQSGLKFSLKMGFKNTKISMHNSYICEGEYTTFVENYHKIYIK